MDFNFKSWKDVSKPFTWKDPLKNVVRGAGSILKIQPTDDGEPRLYHPARTDVDALRGDWARVGNDLKRALDRVADDAKIK